jgi:hypothetical protein
MILPEEQLELLALPVVRARLKETAAAIALAAGSILKPMANEDIDFKEDGILLAAQSEAPLLDTIIEKATQFILKPVTTEGPEKPVPSLTDIALRHLVGPDPLPPICTNWYTALKAIDALPDKIPVLPRDIHQILGSKCPIYSNKRISETHSLYLIPPGTVNELEARVSTYGQQLYSNDENPLRFRHFFDATRQEHGNIQFHEYEWILISNDVLPGSRDQPLQKQAQMVADLSAKSFTDYQVPTLREAVASIFLHKIATGKSLYQAANKQNGSRYTYTRIKETSHGRHLIVGGSAPSGVFVSGGYSYGDYEDIGVAALRKF